MKALGSDAHLRLGLTGLVFGFCLSWLGFADYGEVQRMFTFADLRLLLAFAGAVVLAGLAFALIPGSRKKASRPVHRGTVIGGLTFGVGWALCGACPSIALVQVGEGQLAGLATIVGVFAGTWLCGKVHQRFFRWDPGSCEL